MNSVKKRVQDFQSKYIYQPDAFIKYMASISFDKGIRFNHPLIITWDLVNYCNLNCYFCSAGTSSFKKQNSVIADYKKVLEFIDSCNPIYVTLRGGEPSIHPHFKEILKYLIEKNIFVEVVTNGSGITEEIVKIMSSANQDKIRIKISLDSSDKKINNDQRGEKSFDYALRALCNLGRYQIKNVRVQMVITETNVNGIFEMYKFLHDYNVSSFGVTVMTPFGDSKGLDMIEFGDVIYEEMNNCIEMFNRKKKIRIEKNHLGYKNTLYDDKDYDYNLANRGFRIKCVAGNLKLNIDANGDIYPCDFLKFSNFKVGTIYDPFDEIWNCEKLVYLSNIERKDKKECGSCKNKMCSTGCMGNAYLRFNDILRKDPNCAYE